MDNFCPQNLCPVLWIQIRMDPHHFENLDPDPDLHLHQGDRPNLDPHSDPHQIKIRIRIRTKVISRIWICIRIRIKVMGIRYTLSQYINFSQKFIAKSIKLLLEPVTDLHKEAGSRSGSASSEKTDPHPHQIKIPIRNHIRIRITVTSQIQIRINGMLIHNTACATTVALVLYCTALLAIPD
jgi:hypothetical protein